jgi:hypothetical protein
MNSGFFEKYKSGKPIFKGKINIDSEALELLIPDDNFDEIFLSANPKLKILNVQKYNSDGDLSGFKKEEKRRFPYNYTKISIDFNKFSEKSSEEYIFDLLNCIYATNWEQIENLKINRGNFFSKVLFSNETILHLKIVDNRLNLFLNRKVLDKFEMVIPTIMAYSTFRRKFQKANFVDDLIITMRLMEVLK